MDNQQESSLIVWKTVEEFPAYEVSNTGTIRSRSTGKLKYTNKSHKSGYEYTGFKADGKRFQRKVHRLVAIAHLAPPSEELRVVCESKGSKVVLVNHKDGNKLNNHVSNLEWCDDLHNCHHAYANGLNEGLKGELNGRSVLTEDFVHSMCRDFELGMQPSEAVKLYGVSKAQATKIRAGFAWVHISSQYDIKVNKRKSSTTIESAARAGSE